MDYYYHDLISALNPIASADISDTKSYGAELSENPEDAPITYSYSPAVRAAFARVSDLSQYSENQLDSIEEWVVVSQTKDGEPTGLLPYSWYVETNSLDAPYYFGSCNLPAKLRLLTLLSIGNTILAGHRMTLTFQISGI